MKQDLQARRQLYLSEHDYVFRTLNYKSVLPDWMVSGPELPWFCFAGKKTGY